MYCSYWLDRQLRLVKDQAILTLIEPPYGMRRDHHDGLDLDLDGKGWQKLLQFDIPELSYWSELCKKAHVVAEAELRSDPSFVDSLAKADQEALRVDAGRIGQLRARANAGAGAEDNSDLNLEERLAAALRNGIRAPSVRLDTVGAVFLSANRDATDRMSGGR
jgi:ATP-dependent helicase HepA